MHELVPRWTWTHGCLSHKLMHPHPFLVWVCSPVAIILNSSPACGFHVVINVSTSPVCEACGHASPDKLKPVILRVRWPLCNGQASWLLRLNIVHAT